MSFSAKDRRFAKASGIDLGPNPETEEEALTSEDLEQYIEMLEADQFEDRRMVAMAIDSAAAWHAEADKWEAKYKKRGNEVEMWQAIAGNWRTNSAGWQASARKWRGMFWTMALATTGAAVAVVILAVGK